MPTEIQLTDEVNIIIVMLVGIAVFISFGIGFAKGKKRKHKEENQGEAQVRRILTEYCRKSTAHALNNVTLQYGDGTTQIDHILISQNGILVIETKHYTGWIFANENQKQWTQVVFKVKSKFLNPIFQNLKHVRATQQLLDFLPKGEIISLVVFTGDAEFKTEVLDGVIHVNQLLSFIDAMMLGSISENRVQFSVGRLECKRLELTGKTDIEHQAYLNQKFGETDDYPI